MRKITVLLAALLLCTGCRSESVNTESPDVSEATAANSAVTESASTAESTTAATTSAEETAADTSSAPEPTEEPETDNGQEYLFKPGVWRGNDGYYFFQEDGGGQYLNFEYGIGVGFQREPYSQGSITFHMGAADNNTVFGISEMGEDSVTLTASDGTEDTLIFVCEGDSNTFIFYPNEDLKTMALEYYATKTGYTPQSAAAQNNPDGTVTIQLYDNLEDHNSTSAWYTIDPVTLIGTDDMTGETIDLNGQYTE